MADQENPQTDDTPVDYLAIAKNAFTESNNFFDAGIRRQIMEDMKRFNSQHPEGSKYLHESYRTRAKFFSPKTRAAIRRNEATAAAAFFANHDAIAIEPENQDDEANVNGAKFFNELVNLRFRKSVPWFQTLQGAYQDTQSVGVCVSYQCWAYRAKKNVDRPHIDLRPIENFRFSPAADWRNVVESSPYLIDILPMYVGEVKLRMKSQDSDMPGKWQTVTDVQLLAASKTYSDSIRLARSPGRVDNLAQPSAINDYTTVWVHRNIVEIDGEDWVYYTLADIAMLSTPVRIVKEYPHLKPGQRPYVVGCCVIETHKPYPSSPSRLSANTQELINETVNQRRDNVSVAMNHRYFAKRGAQVDTSSLTRAIANSVTLMTNPETDVKVVESSDVTSNAYEEQNRLNQDFDEVFGTFNPRSVDAKGKLLDTLGGAELITDDANQINNYQLKIFAITWVEPVVMQVVQLERAFETDEAIMRLAASTNEIDSVDTLLLTQEVSVSVNVGVGATTPQKKLAVFIYALKSYKEILEDAVLQNAGMDVEEVGHEIFGKLGYDSGDRFFKWAHGQDPMVAQLQQQIQDLTQKLMKKEDPALTQAKIALLEEQVKKTAAEKVDINTKAMFGALQTAEVIAAIPGTAPIADTILKAGGYVNPEPPGVDPGFAAGEQGALPDPNALITPKGVISHQTGVGFQPGMAPAPGATAPTGNGAAVPSPNTNPMTPKPPAMPATGMVGFNHGIETQRPDSTPK